MIAVVIAALTFLPPLPVDFRHQFAFAYREEVDTLNLLLTAHAAHIDIAFDRTIDPMGYQNAIIINVSETGRVGLDDHGEVPIIQSTTVGNVLTVRSQLLKWWSPFSLLDVRCAIRIDPSMKANLSVKTSDGRIVVYTQAGVILDSLNLEATTGEVEVHLAKDVVVRGDLSVKAEKAEFSWNDVIVTEAILVNVQGTAGGVDLNVKQHEKLLQKVTIGAEATTGAVDFAIDIRGDVGARVEGTTEGDYRKIIPLNIGGFSYGLPFGDPPSTLLRSVSYPASRNFYITLKTTFRITIDASYRP